MRPPLTVGDLRTVKGGIEMIDDPELCWEGEGGRHGHQSRDRRSESNSRVRPSLNFSLVYARHLVGLVRSCRQTLVPILEGLVLASKDGAFSLSHACPSQLIHSQFRVLIVLRRPRSSQFDQISAVLLSHFPHQSYTHNIRRSAS